MLTIVCYGDLWVSKVSVSFLQQLDLKNKIKSGKIIFQLYNIIRH